MSVDGSCVSRVALTIAAVLVGAQMALAVPTEFQSDYDDGFGVGYTLGYDIGYADGEIRGITEGTKQGQEQGYDAGWEGSYSPAYEAAYTVQYPVGIELGHRAGVIRGFDDGYSWARQAAASSGASLSMISFYDGAGFTITTGVAVCAIRVCPAHLPSAAAAFQSIGQPTFMAKV
jgi:hypothetical protein